MEEKLVSVIIPTYNRLYILPKAIESVLNQSYRNLELIIVDDGSTDGTKEYVEGLQDDRVRYIRNEQNMGAGGSRNRGVQEAKGEYVAFQDSDDEWYEDKLKMQMDYINKNPQFSLVYCSIHRYWDGKFLDTVPDLEQPIEEKEGELYNHLVLSPLLSTQTILVKKEAFLALGGFNVELKTMEDYEFSVRFSKIYQIGYVPGEYVRVNADTPDSLDKRYKERIYTHFYIIKSQFDELQKRNLLKPKLFLVKKEVESLGMLDIYEAEMKELENFYIQKKLDERELLIQEYLYAGEIIKVQEVLASYDVLPPKMYILNNMIQVFCQEVEQNKKTTVFDYSLNLDKLVMHYSNLRDFIERLCVGNYDEFLMYCREKSVSSVMILHMMDDCQITNERRNIIEKMINEDL